MAAGVQEGNFIRKALAYLKKGPYIYIKIYKNYDSISNCNRFPGRIWHRCLCGGGPLERSFH